MALNKLVLKNYRIHKYSDIDFSDKVNFIVGGNGQGKTSIIEAIYYLCSTKSLNSFSDYEAVNFAELFFEIRGSFSDVSKNNCRIKYSKEENKKSYFFNDKQTVSASEVIGRFPVSVLTPADRNLTLGSPADRRKFADSSLSQASAVYLDSLLEYNRTLRQRSALLFKIKETRNYSMLSQLDVWTQRMVKLGSYIIKKRKEFVEEFSPYISDSYNFIMQGKEVPKIEYKSSVVFNEESDVEESFFSIMDELKDEEIRRAVNLVGPHKDDFLFSINGNDIKRFGSQGQNKTFQAALKFAQFFFLKNILNKTPIFLLDDVFGELDAERSFKISEYLTKLGQSFITLTNFAKLEFLKSSESLTINISEGVIIYG